MPSGSTAAPSGCTVAGSTGLPDGAVIALEGEGAFAVRGGALLHWTPSGYDARRPLPRGTRSMC